MEVPALLTDTTLLPLIPVLLEAMVTVDLQILQTIVHQAPIIKAMPLLNLHLGAIPTPLRVMGSLEMQIITGNLQQETLPRLLVFKQQQQPTLTTMMLLHQTTQLARTLVMDRRHLQPLRTLVVDLRRLLPSQSTTRTQPPTLASPQELESILDSGHTATLWRRIIQATQLATGKTPNAPKEMAYLETKASQ